MEIILQYFNGCPNWEVLDQRLAEVVQRPNPMSGSYVSWSRPPRTPCASGVPRLPNRARRRHRPVRRRAYPRRARLPDVPHASWDRRVADRRAVARRFPARALTCDARSGVVGTECRIVGPVTAGETRPCGGGRVVMPRRSETIRGCICRVSSMSAVVRALPASRPSARRRRLSGPGVKCCLGSGRGTAILQDGASRRRRDR